MTLQRPRSRPQWTVGGVPVTVRCSARRRTLSLHVSPGAVTIHAPARTPDALISSFLEARRGWAERHLTAYAARTTPAPLVDGAALLFFGETLTLRVGAGTRTPFRSGSEVHVPPGDPDALRRTVERWYRSAALPEVCALVESYADALGARDRLRRVSLSGARTRWGSCTSGGEVRLHWLLSRAPREVAAYVALHEAAHLLELNHSPRYWAHVSRLMPDHATRRAWLRDHGHTLALG